LGSTPCGGGWPTSWTSRSAEFRGTAAQIACVVGGHHGVPSTPGDIALVRDRGDLAGTGVWEQARTALLRWATGLVGGPQQLKRFADVNLGRPSQVLVTALVITADWIASNDELFPLDPLYTADEPPRRSPRVRLRGLSRPRPDSV
jgi:hypothetical protein